VKWAGSSISGSSNSPRLLMLITTSSLQWWMKKLWDGHLIVKIWLWWTTWWIYRSAVAPSTKRSTIGPKRSTIFDNGLCVLFLRRNRRISIASALSYRVTNRSKQTYRARWGYHLSRCNYQTMLVDSCVGRQQVVKVNAGNRLSIMVPTCIQTSVMLI
jgi:hypothetical protein